jgi:predicted RNase H-like HicB family nuclease
MISTAASSNIYKLAQRHAERPYIVIAYADETTYGELIYLAKNPELEGCMAQGETIEKAKQNLHDARIDYIVSLLEDNLPTPEPCQIAESFSSVLASTIKEERQIGTPILEIHQKLSIDFPAALEETNKPYRMAVFYGA